MPAKTTCPVSLQQFREKARPVEVVVNGTPLVASVKEFKTGSLGWYLNGKMTIQIGDVPVAVQIGMNLTILGSKDVPKDSAPAAASAPAATDEPEAVGESAPETDEQPV